jgi:hypothetical protein
MSHWKTRLFAIIILTSAGLIYYNWQQLESEGSYYLKIAAFGPFGVVGGLFLLLFPGKGGRPETMMEKPLRCWCSGSA